MTDPPKSAFHGQDRTASMESLSPRVIGNIGTWGCRSGDANVPVVQGSDVGAGRALPIVRLGSGGRRKAQNLSDRPRNDRSGAMDRNRHGACHPIPQDLGGVHDRTGLDGTRSRAFDRRNPWCSLVNQDVLGMPSTTHALDDRLSPLRPATATPASTAASGRGPPCVRILMVRVRYPQPDPRADETSRSACSAVTTLTGTPSRSIRCARSRCNHRETRTGNVETITSSYFSRSSAWRTAS